VTDAIWVALGEYHARDHVNGLNVGTYLPVALPIWLFGKSEIALSLWPLLCSLLGVASLAVACTILFGRGFGVLAALLYVTYPGDVFFSTVVMPDAIQAGWLSFAMLLIVVSFAGPVDQRRWKLVAAGIALGICHLIRANDVILVPVGVGAVGILSWMWKRETIAAALRGCLILLSGWALVVVLEGAAYLWAAHDFFLRFRVVNRHYGATGSIAQWGLNTDASTIPFSIFAPVTWWRAGNWGHLYPDQAYHGLIFCWALAALVAGLAILTFRRSRIPDRAIAGFAFAAVWCAWPLLYHQFGTQSLSQFVPIHRLSRHLVVYAPGAIIATVAGCFLIKEAISAWRFAIGRRMLMATGLALLLMHLSVNWRGEEVVYGAYHHIKDTYARIRDRLPRGVRQIVADPGDLCFFDFWLNRLGAEQVNLVPFANYSRCEDLTSGVVLTQSNPGWEGTGAPVIQETVARLPCLLHPPVDWRLVYDGYPEKIYLIGGERQPRR
jgi:4-amino-4-deoxy-L-arabinose transferase-like glycosyltransferase